DYAATLPWMRQLGTDAAPAVCGVAGPDALVVHGPRLTRSDHRHIGAFEVAEGGSGDLPPAWLRAGEGGDVDPPVMVVRRASPDAGAARRRHDPGHHGGVVAGLGQHRGAA